MARGVDITGRHHGKAARSSANIQFLYCKKFILCLLAEGLCCCPVFRSHLCLLHLFTGPFAFGDKNFRWWFGVKHESLLLLNAATFFFFNLVVASTNKFHSFLYILSYNLVLLKRLSYQTMLVIKGLGDFRTLTGEVLTLTPALSPCCPSTPGPLGKICFATRESNQHASFRVRNGLF